MARRIRGFAPSSGGRLRRNGRRSRSRSDRDPTSRPSLSGSTAPIAQGQPANGGESRRLGSPVRGLHPQVPAAEEPPRAGALVLPKSIAAPLSSDFPGHFSALSFAAREPRANARAAASKLLKRKGEALELRTLRLRRYLRCLAAPPRLSRKHLKNLAVFAIQGPPGGYGTLAPGWGNPPPPVPAGALRGTRNPR